MVMVSEDLYRPPTGVGYAPTDERRTLQRAAKQLLVSIRQAEAGGMPRASVDGMRRAISDISHSMQIIDGALQCMTDQLPGAPAAASAETGRGGGRAWCWAHQHDLAVCLRDGLGGCQPEMVRHNDPTGDAACQPDRVAGALKQLRRQLRALEDGSYSLARHVANPHGVSVGMLVDRLAGTARAIDATLSAYVIRTRLADADDQKALENENIEPGCDLCAKVRPPGVADSSSLRWWNEVHRTTTLSTVLNTPLTEPLRLCSAHYTRARATGRVPTAAETKHYRDAGKWPQLHTVK